MVQDPLPVSSSDPRTSFAQPIVFFNLEIVRPFSLSGLARSITHLRIRVPTRPVLTQLVEPGAFPSLKVLDISMSALGHPERSLPVLLAQHQNLEHLLLDSCWLSRERWRELARACVLAGQAKSRAREKKVNAWLERLSAEASVPGVDLPVTPESTRTRAARPGRRGVAAAAFSIRTPSESRSASSEPYADRSEPGRSHANATNRTKIRILPPLPSLLTLSTTFTPPPDAQKANYWRAEFESGWRSGVETLLSARARLRTSSMAGVARVRVMRFDSTPQLSRTSHGDDIEESFHNIVDVDLDDTGTWEAECGIPVVCFGGIRPGSQASSNDRAPDSENEDRPDVLHQLFPANGGQAVPTGTFTHVHNEGDAVHTVREGHATGCGHELHEQVWDIHKRAGETS